GRLREGYEECVSLCVHLHTAVTHERTPQRVTVTGQHLRVLVAPLLQQPRRALDVGEQERDCAIRERHDLALFSRRLHGRFVQRLPRAGAGGAGAGGSPQARAGGRGQAGSEAFASSPRMRAQSALSSVWATFGFSLTTGAKASGERANVVMPSGPVTTEADRGRPSIKEISPK